MQNSIKNLVALLIAVLAGTAWTVNSYLESRSAEETQVVRNSRLLDLLCESDPALELCSCAGSDEELAGEAAPVLVIPPSEPRPAEAAGAHALNGRS